MSGRSIVDDLVALVAEADLAANLATALASTQAQLAACQAALTALQLQSAADAAACAARITELELEVYNLQLALDMSTGGGGTSTGGVTAAALVAVSASQFTLNSDVNGLVQSPPADVVGGVQFDTSKTGNPNYPPGTNAAYYNYPLPAAMPAAADGEFLVLVTTTVVFNTSPNLMNRETILGWGTDTTEIQGIKLFSVGSDAYTYYVNGNDSHGIAASGGPDVFGKTEMHMGQDVDGMNASIREWVYPTSVYGYNRTSKDIQVSTTQQFDDVLVDGQTSKRPSFFIGCSTDGVAGTVYPMNVPAFTMEQSVTPVDPDDGTVITAAMITIAHDPFGRISAVADSGTDQLRITQTGVAAGASTTAANTPRLVITRPAGFVDDGTYEHFIVIDKLEMAGGLEASTRTEPGCMGIGIADGAGLSDTSMTNAYVAWNQVSFSGGATAHNQAASTAYDGSGTQDTTAGGVGFGDADGGYLVHLEAHGKWSPGVGESGDVGQCELIQYQGNGGVRIAQGISTPKDRGGAACPVTSTLEAFLSPGTEVTAGEYVFRARWVSYKVRNVEHITT